MMLRAYVWGGSLGKCLSYVAVLIGTMGIVADVAAAENNSSLAPLIPSINAS
jgi:hypothetical protein